MKNYTIFAILILVSLTTFGQVNQKTVPSNKNRLQIYSDPEKTVTVLAKGDIATIKKITADNGGVFRFSSGNIASIKMKLKYVSKLIQNPLIKQIEIANSHYQPLNDKMILADRTNVISLEDSSCLGYNLFGKGVVVGIIDEGIDFRHQDFQNEDSSTRIKFFWDQTDPSTANRPQPYDYGREWNAAQIDAGLCTDYYDYNSHGTIDAGIAAGDGLCDGSLHHGVAPKADLVIVKYDGNNTTDNTISDGTAWIYEKAASLGEPCVINVSLGDYFGSHDGTDLVAQLIDNLVTANVGQSFVCAVGNEGGSNFHVSTTVTSDTSFTWLTDPTMYVEMWGDTSQFNNIKFSIGADSVNINTNYYSFDGHIPFRTDTFYHLANTIYSDVLLNNSGQTIANIMSAKIVQGNVIGIQIQINPVTNGTDTNHLFRLMTTGAGKFDAYSWDFQQNNSLPNSSTYAPMAYYQYPDTNQNICSSFQCSKHVITVGAYANRDSAEVWCIDTNSNLHVVRTGPIVGQIWGQSSCGPTRDNRIKPDVTSPGLWMFSPGALGDLAAFKLTASGCEKVSASGCDIFASGTSMASPSVAGIAALFLEVNTFDSSDQVRNCIIYNTRSYGDPSIWGPVPNNRWGYGKADACLALHCTNPYSFDAGIPKQNPSNSYLSNYPNPFSDQTSISYSLPNNLLNSKAEITINDLLGNMIITIPLDNNSGTIPFNKSQLASGIYFYSLKVEGRTISTKKMMVL